jgi:hypothetical protein
MNKKLSVMPPAPREVEAARVAKLSLRPDLTLAGMKLRSREGGSRSRAPRAWS